jgi:V/A-type H+-transporting ATPase subunit K
MKSRLKAAIVLTILSGTLAALSTVFLWFPDAWAAEAAKGATPLPPEAFSWGFIGAAVSTGLAALGAGIAVANVGTAAIGAMAEKPELFGRLLILVGLAEGIAIYGLIVSILILNRLG